MSVQSTFRCFGIILVSIIFFLGGAFGGIKIVSQITQKPLSVTEKMESGALVRGTPLHGANNIKQGHVAACEKTLPQNPHFSARFIDTTIPDTLTPGSVATITIRIQNTGDITWFNDNHHCDFSAPIIHLGTTKDHDRSSVLYIKDGRGWLNPQRITMEELSVAPGENATFTFDAQLPAADDFLREYFAIVVEGGNFGQWLDDSPFYLDLTVGSLSENLVVLAHYYQKSGTAAVLTGDKKIDVDLSEQKMVVKVGEVTLMEYRISSGKASTPTPTGNFKILFKNDVRISGLGIPYIMPNYMGFANGGAYGLHALPSLSYDNGYFWTEALNHIGIPVSHGCIRLLPDDAKTLYAFADIGTSVIVHQ